MAELINLEKETQILFNEAEKTAQVYTINRRLIRRLKAVAERDSSRCKFEKRDEWGFEWWTIDKRLVSFGLPRTEKQKLTRVEKSKKAVLARKRKKEAEK